MKEKESMDYKDIKISKPTVYVVQEIAGTREGRPKFNIMGAAESVSYTHLTLPTTPYG